MKRVGLKITLLIGLLFVGQMAGAELPRVGSLVPAVSVQRGGEIMLGKGGYPSTLAGTVAPITPSIDYSCCRAFGG